MTSRAMESSPKQPVLVTGATSFVGSHVIATLLARNYIVRGTEPTFPDDILEALRSFPRSENLSLLSLDLKDPESFVQPLSGCRALIHVATPVLLPLDGSLPFRTTDEAIQKQIKPAVEGTKALFTAAARAGVKRIVLTSSTASMLAQRTVPSVLDENCWSDEEFCKETMMTHPYGAYRLAKLQQEKIARTVAETMSLQLVCVHPGFIVGPTLLPSVNGSVAMLLELLEGRGCSVARCKAGMIPDQYCHLIDVREVAMAHVLALEQVQKSRRIDRIVALSQSPLYVDMYKKLCEHDAFMHYPERPIDSSTPRKTLSYDNSKMRQMGVKEISWEESLAESASSLAAHKNNVRGLNELNET